MLPTSDFFYRICNWALHFSHTEMSNLCYTESRYNAGQCKDTEICLSLYLAFTTQFIVSVKGIILQNIFFIILLKSAYNWLPMDKNTNCFMTVKNDSCMILKQDRYCMKIVRLKVGDFMVMKCLKYSCMINMQFKAHSYSYSR